MLLDSFHQLSVVKYHFRKGFIIVISSIILVFFCYGLLKQNQSAKVLIKYFPLLLLAKGLSLQGAVLLPCLYLDYHDLN